MSNYTEGILWAVGEGFFYSLNVLGKGRPACGTSQRPKAAP
jgi:hypothetical protein